MILSFKGWLQDLISATLLILHTNPVGLMSSHGLRRLQIDLPLYSKTPNSLKTSDLIYNRSYKFFLYKNFHKQGICILWTKERMCKKTIFRIFIINWVHKLTSMTLNLGSVLNYWRIYYFYDWYKNLIYLNIFKNVNILQGQMCLNKSLQKTRIFFAYLFLQAYIQFFEKLFSWHFATEMNRVTRFTTSWSFFFKQLPLGPW
jgi:hypothetical protein